jgi:hypothetical protein
LGDWRPVFKEKVGEAPDTYRVSFLRRKEPRFVCAYYRRVGDMFFALSPQEQKKANLALRSVTEEEERARAHGW